MPLVGDQTFRPPGQRSEGRDATDPKGAWIVALFALTKQSPTKVSVTAVARASGERTKKRRTE